jgi:hypothetical protein
MTIKEEVQPLAKDPASPMDDLDMYARFCTDSIIPFFIQGDIHPRRSYCERQVKLYISRALKRQRRKNMEKTR